MDERVELDLDVGASFHLSHTVLKNSRSSKNKGTSIRNFVPNSGLEKILQRHIDRRNVLSTKLDKVEGILN